MHPWNVLISLARRTSNFNWTGNEGRTLEVRTSTGLGTRDVLDWE